MSICTRCGQTEAWAADLDQGWPENWSAWYAFRTQGVYLTADEVITPQHLLCSHCSGEAYEFFLGPKLHPEGT